MHIAARERFDIWAGKPDATHAGRDILGGDDGHLVDVR